MANEITILETRPSGSTALLFLFPIPANLKVTGAVPTPTPRDEQGVPIGWGALLTAEEQSALDTGDLYAEQKLYTPNPSDTPPQRLATIRSIYANRKAALAGAYTLRYEFYGQRFNEN